MKLHYKKLVPEAIAPEYQSNGAAAFDLHAIENRTLVPGERHIFKSGLAVEIPEGFVGLICSRSGLAAKHGIQVLNAPGVIDSDYRGDVGTILYNAGMKPLVVSVGDRISQMLIMPVAHVRFQEVDELTDSVRNAAGFGSTGT